MRSLSSEISPDREYNLSRSTPVPFSRHRERSADVFLPGQIRLAEGLGPFVRALVRDLHLDERTVHHYVLHLQEAP